MRAYLSFLAFSHYKTLLQGFLGGHEIAASTNGEGSGNFGMADQRLAMTWVQRHIEAFGGDGHAVTIFGESAGGNSIINHLAQPASFDLYARAISESGTYDVGAHSMAESEAGYRAGGAMGSMAGPASRLGSGAAPAWASPGAAPRRLTQLRRVGWHR